MTSWQAIWGGCYKSHRAHIDFDVMSSVVAFVTAQEATQPLLEHLRAPGVEGVAEEGARTHGGGVKWRIRPTFQFYGFRGPEPLPSLLICARKSLVSGMRLLYFKLRNDGPYSATVKPKKAPRYTVTKMARSRMLIVACHMRYWRLGSEDSTRGGGDNLLVLMTVHLHNMTAKKDIQQGGKVLKISSMSSPS